MSGAAFAEPIGQPEVRQPAIDGRIMAVGDLDNAVKALLFGLITPGERFKQGSMEAALRALCSDEWVDRAQAEFKWTPGRTE